MKLVINGRPQPPRGSGVASQAWDQPVYRCQVCEKSALGTLDSTNYARASPLRLSPFSRLPESVTKILAGLGGPRWREGGSLDLRSGLRAET